MDQIVVVVVVHYMLLKRHHILWLMLKGVQDQKGQSEKVLNVPMVFKTPEGVEIIKTFTFTQGQYPIVVKHQVINRSQQSWQGQMLDN